MTGQAVTGGSSDGQDSLVLSVLLLREPKEEKSRA